MKGRLLVPVLIFISLLFSACEDTIGPKTTFHEGYVVNCVIHSDSNKQFASLSRTYDVEGLDPYTNPEDPAIRDAQVFLIHRGTVYKMRDTSIARADTSRYKGPIYFYWTDAFIPRADDSVKIIAIPKDGVSLTSGTKIPSRASIRSTRSAILHKDEADITFTWTSKEKDIYLLPRLKIVYTITNEFPNKVYIAEVPTGIDQKGNKIYPLITKSTDNLFYSADLINQTMNGIAGTNERQNYRIAGLELEIKYFDEFLSSYISSTNIFFNDISVRLDEPNYTNIRGGLGFFGSSVIFHKAITLSSEYVQSFGYIPL